MPFAVPDIETDLQCHHIHAPAGNRCGSPSLKGEYYCFHHHLKHARRNQRRLLIDPEITRMEIPVVEDRASIFTALAAILHRLAENTIDTTRSGQMIYALHTMLRALPPEPPPAPAHKDRHPERSAEREAEEPVLSLSKEPREAAPATAAGVTPPPDPTPPKTILITKESLVYFLRSRHCYNCNAELFPAEELTERPNPGAPPQIIEESSPTLPAASSHDHPCAIILPILRAVADTAAHPAAHHKSACPIHDSLTVMGGVRPWPRHKFGRRVAHPQNWVPHS